MTTGKLTALHGLANAGVAQQTFLGYLALQALVLLLWWPKTSLFDRIGTTGEPATLAAVVIFTGAVLGYFAIQLSVEELAGPKTGRPQRAAEDSLSSTPPLECCKIHLLQLGYLMALCAPITLVAHSIASVAATHLLWIAAITAVHTTFYQLLGLWLRLRWLERDRILVSVAARVALVSIYLFTSVYVPGLSHVRMSFQLAQPQSSSPTSMATFVLPFIVAYAALCALLCVGLLRQLSKQRANETPKSDADL